MITQVASLLATPSKPANQLRGSEFASHHALLELFCYGTWTDYRAQSASLPALNEQQTTKLKQLTVVSLATKIKVLTGGPQESYT